MRVDEHGSEENHFQVRVLKIVNSKPYNFIAEMKENGLGELILQK